MNNFIRLLTLLIFVALGITKLNAQDIHFSQYQYSPLTLNPASVGNFDGNWRFSNNYRNQWSSVGIPFQTISVGFDKPFKTRSGAFGLGILFYNDRSGSSALTTNKVGLSVAYHLKVSDNHYIGLGIQGAYAVQAFSVEELTFPGQFNNITGYFDNLLPNNVDQWDENINYPDINAGVYYRGVFGKMKAYGGIAMYHVNKPKVSFLRENNQMNMRVAGHAGVNIMMTENIYLEPRILCMYQKKASDYVAGVEAGYLFPTKSVIEQAYGGLGFRTSFNTYDAVIVSGGIGLYRFLLGVSYDVNVSSLSTVSNLKGAFEITLIYKDFTKVLNQITLPCDRY